MRFTIPQKSLAGAMASAQNILAKRQTIPVLDNVLIEAMDGCVRVTATDLDNCLRITADAKVAEMGQLCLPARRLFEVARSLPDADITLSADEWSGKLVCGDSKFTFSGVDPERFPLIENAPETTVTIPSAIFGEMLRKVAFLTTDDISNSALNAVKCTLQDGTLTFVATDKTALAVGGAIVEGSLEALIPKQAFREAARLEGDVSIADAEHHIFFVTEDKVLSSRKLTGTFPKYEIVLSNLNCTEKITVGADQFLDSLRRAALMADERLMSIRMSLEPDRMLFTAKSEVGDAFEPIPATYSGENITFALDRRYALDFAALAPKGSEIEIHFRDKTSPMDCRIVGDDNYRFILQPLNVKD